MHSIIKRAASHAGSWYSSSKTELDSQLTTYLNNAEQTLTHGLLKGIIGPHAGYSYSGPTAAWAYKNIDPSKYNRVILLGPSHHVYMDGCALTKCQAYETPLGDITIDTATTEELYKNGKFVMMSQDTDEDEHSLEMHLPYIKKVFGDKDFKLVPIMVGSIKKDKEEYYGKLLAPYMKDKETLFIVSSDFCHWGKRFSFTYYNEADGQIYESIEKLDRRGMEAIESQDPDSFVDYVHTTKNTVCGRHPIAVFMYAMKASELAMETKFVKYAQSSQVKDKNDSSVSYASSYSTDKNP